MKNSTISAFLNQSIPDVVQAIQSGEVSAYELEQVMVERIQSDDTGS